MSNLGLYQKTTTYSKKIGEPINFSLLVADEGYGVGKIIETDNKLPRSKLRGISPNLALLGIIPVVASYRGINP